ncbi:beta-alanyl-dopamine/carcinine hydrolase-like [Branchiostoma lanceolatum]|uniref:beta-alanyl-dopamine/carcinine hydrolase-like n=1 Tax=Branchiostoma lanceolatum TaxID=7740 RepID=UPI0034555FFF
MAPRVLHVSGTNRQVGVQVGKATKRQIQDAMSSYEPFKEIISSLETSEGRRVYEGFLKAAKTAYPNYVEELEGMAEGAEVPFEHLFIVNFEFERELLTMKKQDEEEGLKGCTTVFLNYRDGPRVLAHNEDGPAGEQGCIVAAHIEPYRLPGGKILPEENFVSYCYTCLLPGVAYSFNSRGLCITCNTLVSKDAEENKIGVSFACRAVLSATSVEEAVAMLKGDGVGMAIGYSFNMVSTRDSTRRMYSVETAAAVGQATTLVSVHAVEPVDGSTEGHFYHYNLYEHLSVPEWPLSPSSHHRKARASELVAPRTKEDVLAVLGDTEDPEYPIYRSGTGRDKGYTLNTAVFDLQKGVMEVHTGNPTADKKLEPALQFILPA